MSTQRKHTTKSALIRELYDDGYTISEIAKQLNAHYSFVHGVVRRHEAKQAKEQARKLAQAQTQTKKREQAREQNEEHGERSRAIRELHDQGRTNPEIVAVLKVSHSFVSNVIRAYQNKKGELSNGKSEPKGESKGEVGVGTEYNRGKGDRSVRDRGRRIASNSKVHQG